MFSHFKESNYPADTETSLKKISDKFKQALSHLLDCKKDVFYRFMSNPKIHWRKLVYYLNLQFWSKIKVRSEHKEGTTCLIVDDTDYPKTGRRIDNIGRVHSHVQNKCILGFKALSLAITDGTSQLILDFAILGEKGGKGNYGTFAKELKERFTKERDQEDALQERIREYSTNKIDLTIDMIKRGISKGIRFRYVLADSWFACKDIIRFIRSRHILFSVPVALLLTFAETIIRCFCTSKLLLFSILIIIFTAGWLWVTFEISSSYILEYGNTWTDAEIFYEMIFPCPLFTVLMVATGFLITRVYGRKGSYR